MHEIFKSLSIVEQDTKIFGDNSDSILIFYCVAIGEHRLPSIADNNIFIVKDIILDANKHYLLKINMQNYELSDMLVLCNGTFLIIGCSNELAQVNVVKIGESNLHKVVEFDCCLLNKESSLGYVERLTNVILPKELEYISKTGKFVYSCDYDEYLSLI